jgi:copper(I)-binding protein
MKHGARTALPAAADFFQGLIMQLRSIVIFVAALAAGAAHAQELRISQAYARATAPYQPAGAAYLTIENAGRSTDKLLSATSPAAASVEIHTMAMEGNVMKMREAPALEVPPAAKLEMKPGAGYHLMLMGLRQPLKAGEKFPVTLNFEKAGRIEVDVSVQDQSQHGGMHR